MACSKTKRLDNKNWPFYRITKKSRLCCYVVTVKSKRAAARVIDDAVTRPDYVKQSQFYETPNNMIWFYLYFKQS